MCILSEIGHAIFIYTETPDALAGMLQIARARRFWYLNLLTVYKKSV